MERMVNDILLSVIIPVRNNAETLDRAIKSVVEQKCDWEMVIVYDESEDDSLNILKNYSEKDSRIRLVYGRNKNLSAARNDGIDNARGEYILFLDADDAYLPNAFSTLRMYMTRDKSDIYVFGSEINAGTKLIPLGVLIDLAVRNKKYKEYNSKALFGETGARPFVWRNAYKRDFVIENSLKFDEEMLVGEDQVFQLEAFPFAKNGIRFIRKKIYEYSWLREGSLTSKYCNNRYFKLGQHIKMVNTVSNFWKSKGDTHYLDYDKLVAWAVYFLAEEIPYLDYSVQKDYLCKEATSCLRTMINDADIFISSSCRRRLGYLERATSKPQWNFFLDKLYWYWKYGGIVPATLVFFIKCVQVKRKYTYFIRNKHMKTARKRNDYNKDSI